tara:strand:- start:783 stop:1796 length:1014 start_codon:yes stop_codon:yes gene_type:complete
MAIGTAALIGAGIKAGTGALSFQQASQVKNLRKDADKSAAEYLAKASDTINKDYFASLKVPMEAYEAELLSNLQASTTAISALSEAGSRELIGGVGRVNAVQREAGESARLAQQQELFALDKMKAENKDSMNQQQLQLQVAGEQDRIKRNIDFDEQRASLQKQGLSSLTGAATQLVGGLSDTPISKEDKKLQSLLKENNISASEYGANPDKYKFIFDQKKPFSALESSPSAFSMLLPQPGPENDPYLNMLPGVGGFTTPGQRRGTGPMNIQPNQFGGVGAPTGISGLNIQGQQDPRNAFANQGYMGFDLNQMANPLDYPGIFPQPSMDDLLKKYGVK